MKYLTAIITLPLTLLALSFALSNQQDVTASLWPFDATLIWPLYAVALPMLALGFFCGALFVWLHAQRARFRSWRQGRLDRKAHKNLIVENEALKKAQAAAPANVPALPVTGATLVRPSVADTPLLETRND